MQHRECELKAMIAEKSPFIDRCSSDGTYKSEVNMSITEINRVQYLRPPRTDSTPEPYQRTGLSLSTIPTPNSNRVREWLRKVYDKDSTQMVVSIIIVLNGLMHVIQTTAWTDSCCVANLEVQQALDYVEYCFLSFYTIELTLNLYAHFFWDFWIKSKWNRFDFIVIVCSWIPNKNVAAIRLLRTLRLVRISGRVQSVVFIMETLQKSMKGIGTLMVLLTGVMSIYAVLGVGLFADTSEEFEDFFSAFWTLFITLNGESWPDLAYPLVEEYWYTSLYFGSFIITASVVVLNMIIAVFIEKTAEVLRARRDQMFKESLLLDELVPLSNDLSRNNSVVGFMSNTRFGERCDFINRARLQCCIFVLFNWENKKLLSRLECRRGISRILTSDGFNQLADAILEKRLKWVQSLLRTS